jgi:hypothetical protein
MAKGKPPGGGGREATPVAQLVGDATSDGKEDALSVPPLESPPTNLPAIRPADVEFRTFVSKFIRDQDDTRGFLALALFFLEAVERDGRIDEKKLYSAFAAARPETLAVTHQTSANRMLDIHFAKLRDKLLDEEVRDKRMFYLMTQEIGSLRESIAGETAELRGQIKDLEATQTFPRQVLVTATTAVIVAIVALTVTYAPELGTALQRLFGH